MRRFLDRLSVPLPYIKTFPRFGSKKGQGSNKGSGLEKSDLSAAPFSNNLADGRIKMADLFFPVITSSAIEEPSHKWLGFSSARNFTIDIALFKMAMTQNCSRIIPYSF